MTKFQVLILRGLALLIRIQAHMANSPDIARESSKYQSDVKGATLAAADAERAIDRLLE